MEIVTSIQECVAFSCSNTSCIWVHWKLDKLAQCWPLPMCSRVQHFRPETSLDSKGSLSFQHILSEQIYLCYCLCWGSEFMLIHGLLSCGLSVSRAIFGANFDLWNLSSKAFFPRGHSKRAKQAQLWAHKSHLTTLKDLLPGFTSLSEVHVFKFASDYPGSPWTILLDTCLPCSNQPVLRPS